MSVNHGWQNSKKKLLPMTDQASFQIVIVCEGPSDLPTARGFAERILRERVDWLRETPEALPAWRGLRENQPFLKWTAVDDEFDDAHLINRQGHFNGLPGKADSKAARKALQVIAHYHRAPLAIVLMRDADSQPVRREGLEQARQEFEQLVGHQVLIGFADPKSEAWIIAGFQPTLAREREHLENFRSENSFDPTREPHKLRSRENDTRDAKHVLGKLTNDDTARAEPCWSETPLEILHANGDACGLKAYLEEVESRLVPLFDASLAR
jgi:hypothetical protein